MLQLSRSTVCGSMESLMLLGVYIGVLVVAVGRRRGLDVEDVAAGVAELLVLAVAVGLRQGDGQLAGGCAALGDVGDLVLVVLALAPDERVQA